MISFQTVSAKMTKPKNKRTNKNRSENIDVGPKNREFFVCKCTLHCNGGKLVKSRTFNKHQEEMERLHVITSGSHSSSQSRIIESETDDIGLPSSSRRKKERVKSIEEIQDPLKDYSGDDPWPVSGQNTNYDAKTGNNTKFDDL